MNLKKYFFLFCVLSFSLFIATTSLQVDSSSNGCGIPTECPASWTEYRATTNENMPLIETRSCSRSLPYCVTSCSSWSPCDQFGSWQVAERPGCPVTSSGVSKPTPRVEPSYFQKPKNPKYYTNPFFPVNYFQPENSKSQNNINLPVKLVWDSIEGWKEGWREGVTGAQCIKECPGGDNLALHSYPEECKDPEEREEIIDCFEDVKYETKYSEVGECLEETINEFDFTVNVAQNPVEANQIPHAALDRARKEVEKELQYRETLQNCILDGEQDCYDKYQSNKACGTTCPYPDQTFERSKFIEFYVLEIEGPMRDWERMKELETLTRAFEYEGLSSVSERRSYRDRMEEIIKDLLLIDYYKTTVDKPEFIPPFSCMFSQGENYRWRVKGCDTADENTCGDWSDWWEFTTSLAPEPMSPPDPDWEGPGGDEDDQWLNIIREDPSPLNIADLRWCKPDLDENYPYTPIEFPSYRALLREKHIDYPFHPPSLEGIRIHPLLKDSDGEERVTPLPETLFERYAPSRLLNTDKEYFRADPDYVYLWNIVACRTNLAENCENYGQTWSFHIPEGLRTDIKITYPEHDPEGEDPVEISPDIQWTFPFVTISYIYEIYDSSNITPNNFITSNVTPFRGFNFTAPSLDSFYTTRVKTCYDEEGIRCCQEGWSPGDICNDNTPDVWARSTFLTTGAPPNLINPTDGDIDVNLPVNLRWETVGGSESFIVEINNREYTVNSSSTATTSLNVDYPDLRQQTTYSWRVKTCAERNGVNCGVWSAPNTFTTVMLSAPDIISPENEEVIFLRAFPQNVLIDWEEVESANYYKYETRYIGDEENCETDSSITGGSSSNISIPCLGDYEWRVASCFDSGCNDMSSFSNWTRFSFQEREGRETGLVPCGRSTNNPKTEWNETDPCEIKHLFILLKVIIDFIIGTLVPLFLLFLFVSTGTILYTSQGNPNVLVKIKSIWRSFAIGFGIILLAFTIVTLFMSILGYQASLYTPWWDITF